MELIIQILMVFIIINCILKLSFRSLWQSILFGAICAVFIIWTKEYAIMQSKTQIADYLKNRTALQNTAVLVTAESAICFAFCFAALKNMFGKRVKRWLMPLYWYPSLLIFPVLFYILTQTIFSLSGTDFDTIAYIISGITFVVIPIAAYGIRLLIPEDELRLEIHFLVSLFVCILGLLTTVNGDVTYAAVKEPVNFKALGLSLGLFVVTFVIGYVWNKIKWSIRQKKKYGI
jgi:hypothetical protein